MKIWTLSAIKRIHFNPEEVEKTIEKIADFSEIAGGNPGVEMCVK